jgi:peptidoglycan biosynthesis protein MviN/MurJ (putative lipid II flippase)
MFKVKVSGEFLKKPVKISCIVQLANAFMDYFLWVTVGYHVPSWTLATLVVGYSALLLSYDRLIAET